MEERPVGPREEVASRDSGGDPEVELAIGYYAARLKESWLDGWDQGYDRAERSIIEYLRVAGYTEAADSIERSAYAEGTEDAEDHSDAGGSDTGGSVRVRGEDAGGAARAAG